MVKENEIIFLEENEDIDLHENEKAELMNNSIILMPTKANKKLNEGNEVTPNDYSVEEGVLQENAVPPVEDGEIPFYIIHVNDEIVTQKKGTEKRKAEIKSAEIQRKRLRYEKEKDKVQKLQKELEVLKDT